MNYAIVENNIVTNLIWLDDNNAADFSGAVKLNDLPVAIGDSYDGTDFFHDGVKVISCLEEIQNLYDEQRERLADAENALAILFGGDTA